VKNRNTKVAQQPHEMGSQVSSQDRPMDSSLDMSNVPEWTVENVCHWVILKSEEDSSLSKLSVQSLIQHQIDGKKLLLLDDEKLQSMNIKKLACRTSILKRIQELKDESCS